MCDYLLHELQNNGLYTLYLWFLSLYTVCLPLWESSDRSDAEHQKSMYFEVIQPANILLTELFTLIFFFLVIYVFILLLCNSILRFSSKALPLIYTADN